MNTPAFPQKENKTGERAFKKCSKRVLVAISVPLERRLGPNCSRIYIRTYLFMGWSVREGSELELCTKFMDTL